jgi:hypothetical protein
MLPGCRTSPSLGPPPAVVPLSGSWAGTITGRAMASAGGIIETPARLTLHPDGRWTLGAGNAIASGAARRRGHGVVLEGVMTAGDPMAVGRAVSFFVGPPESHVLYGRGQIFHLGHRVDVAIMLRRIPAPRPESGDGAPR